jgi:uncharacterized membrane protein
MSNKAKSLFPPSLETLFLVIGLLFGTIFVFINPPFQANDEDRHFYRAYANANLRLLPIQQDSSQGNMVGTVYPKSVIYVAQKFQGLPIAQGRKISMRELFNPMKEIKLNPDDTTFYMYPYSNMSFIPYIPHSIGITVGRLIDSNPVWLQWFGRLGGMIAFIFIVYYAIRITPIIKPVFFLAALTPMSLYQAASITYDSLSTATSFLLMALFLKYAFDDKARIGWRELTIILLTAFVQRYSKDGYFIIPFMFFIIPMGKMEKSWFSWLALGAFILLIFLPDWTWGKIIGSLDFRPGGEQPFQNDFLFDRPRNMEYNMSNLPEFISNIFSNLIFWKSDWAAGAIGKFGYSYTAMPKVIYFIHGLVLIIVAFLSGSKKYLVNIRQKLLVFGILLISFMLIIVGFYLAGSPVGAVKIFGLQGRYFVPFIPMILLLFYTPALRNSKWEKWESMSIGAYSIIILTYTVFYLKDTFYAP